MRLNRRMMLAGATVLPSLLQAQKATHKFKLRYGPRIGLVPNLSVLRQLEIYAENGFTAFEYNGLPSHSMQEIEAFRKKRDELKMSMGIFVVNRGGWRPTAMPDKSEDDRVVRRCEGLT